MRWCNNGTDGLREMCNTGVMWRDLYFSGEEKPVLRFDCFNEEESNYVKDYMNVQHPDIPFFTTYVGPVPKEAQQ